MRGPETMRQGTLGALVCGFLAILAAGGCATGGLRDFVLEPASGMEAAVARGESGVRASARYLDRQAIEAFARDKGQGELAYRLRDMRMTAFALTVENQGTAGVMFDPRGIRLSSGGRETFSPLEYSHLYMALPDEGNRQEVLRGLSRLLFEGMLDLPPGGAAERIVLFKRPETFGRKGVLLLGGIYVNGKPTSLALEFKAIPAR